MSNHYSLCYSLVSQSLRVNLSTGFCGNISRHFLEYLSNLLAAETRLLRDKLKIYYSIQMKFFYKLLHILALLVLAIFAYEYYLWITVGGFPFVDDRSVLRAPYKPQVLKDHAFVIWVLLTVFATYYTGYIFQKVSISKSINFQFCLYIVSSFFIFKEIIFDRSSFPFSLNYVFYFFYVQVILILFYFIIQRRKKWNNKLSIFKK